MLDFKELSQDGTDLELLVREILLIKGFKVQWSGKGPDGGRDLICFEERKSEFLDDRKIWLIQCKHNAHGGGSVGVNDIDDIVDSCSQHRAEGYLLICSTFPSSGVINRLEGITNNPKSDIDATYWDATIIEQKLSTSQLWRIAQTFFPVSSANALWQIYATEHPNHWIVNYKGYHFHLTNRIGSTADYHLRSFDRRIADIENIKLKEDHFIRIRAVYFDDKNGGYTWYLDYMYPHDQSPIMLSKQIEIALGDDYALEDGQWYSFDVSRRPYYKYSDHYDKDHYDYYVPYLNNFRGGSHRRIRDEQHSDGLVMWDEYEGKRKGVLLFEQLVDKFKAVAFIKVIRAVNSSIEDINKFVKLRDWAEIIMELDIDVDHFFSAWLLIDVGRHESELLRLMSYFPMSLKCWFRLTKVMLFLPNDAGDGSEYEEHEQSQFELSFRVLPEMVHTSEMGRGYFNNYFEQCILAIDRYINENKA